MSKFVAIGDIHGCIGALELLLDRIRARNDLADATLVFLGDYIDRGESSVRVLDALISIQKARDNNIFLMGNHEYELLSGRPFGLDTGDSALLEYPDYKMAHNHIAFLESLSSFHESNHFVFVHGGIPNGFSGPKGVSVEKLVWEYGVMPNYNGKRVIHGHAARAEVRENQHSICIDTGCYSSSYGHLTAIVLDDRFGKIIGYIQVQNPKL